MGIWAGVIVGLLEGIFWAMSRFLTVTSGGLITLSLTPTMQVLIGFFFASIICTGGTSGYVFARLRAEIPINSPYLKAGVFGACVWILPQLASWLITQVGRPLLDLTLGGLGALTFAYLFNKWANTKSQPEPSR